MLSGQLLLISFDVQMVTPEEERHSNASVVNAGFKP